MRPLIPAVLVFAVAACGPSTSSGPDAGPSTSTATTSYLRDVQPILEASCLGCHREGGIAPLTFDTPELAQVMGPSIINAIETGRMPPFYASADCNSYQHDPRLSAEQTALVRRWVDEGGPIGDPADEKHATIPDPPQVRHDVEMSIGGDFDVNTMNEQGSLDNYRCFALDPKATEDLMVPGYEVMPGNVALVHHVLAYVVPPDLVGQLDTLDQNAAGPGYPCKSGGVGINGVIQNQIAGWVPGATAARLPPGTALKLAKGSKIVMQIHYNLNALGRAGVAPTDQTKLALEFAPADSLTTARILPMLKHNLDIKAYDASSVQTGQLPAGLAYRNAKIYAVMGHAHQLATSIKLERVSADGQSQCLMNIKNWDFNWQRTYDLVTPVTLGQNDQLRITCTYDNSAENQPTVNGAKQMPRDVQWGESSFDEMCMTYMTFTQ